MDYLRRQHEKTVRNIIFEEQPGVPSVNPSYHDLSRLWNISSHIFHSLNITYWATGGTLLGAIKTGSFVELDDDIDVNIIETGEARRGEER